MSSSWGVYPDGPSSKVSATAEEPVVRMEPAGPVPPPLGPGAGTGGVEAVAEPEGVGDDFGLRDEDGEVDGDADGEAAGEAAGLDDGLATGCHAGLACA
jgi:hypothetical protein